MRFDIPLRFVPDVALKETIRTAFDLVDMGMDFEAHQIEISADGICIVAEIPENCWPEVRDYIAVSPAVELDEETLEEWANDPDAVVIG